ncbi:MAG: acyl-CoA dehydrogenase family protein [Acidimicrobiales bacterium]
MAAARRVADGVLAPSASATDQAPTIPDSHLGALAGAGLFGLLGPVEHGGHAAGPAVTREVFETLAGACGVTFFVWVQHHAPVRLLTASPNHALAGRLLGGLCSGGQMGGVAFAHLRRPGPPPVVARPVAGGYVLSGEAPWATSWGLAGVYAVAARLRDRAVFVAVQGRAGERVRPSAPLRLAAMNASSTVRLEFRDLFVPEQDVIVDLPIDRWRAQDRVITAQPNPAVFGVAATCTRLLAELDAGAASGLEDERLEVRGASYRLADEGDAGDEQLAKLVDLRARSLDVALRAAQALVVATGGRAMELAHPAQRLLREASFYAIQAQTPALRQATLRDLQTRRATSTPAAAE